MTSANQGGSRMEIGTFEKLNVTRVTEERGEGKEFQDSIDINPTVKAKCEEAWMAKA